MGAIESSQLLTRRRYTVADYHRLPEVGILSPDERVELIDGQVVEMAPIGSRHSNAVKGLTRRLYRRLGDDVIISVQDPLRLDNHNEVQPDVMVLRGPADDRPRPLPTVADVLLLIEVSDTSSRIDREIKVPLYASSGVQDVWVLDLDARLLRCYREPRGAEYMQVQVLAQPGLVALPGLQGLAIDVSGLLPPA